MARAGENSRDGETLVGQYQAVFDRARYGVDLVPVSWSTLGALWFSSLSMSS